MRSATLSLLLCATLAACGRRASSEDPCAYDPEGDEEARIHAVSGCFLNKTPDAMRASITREDVTYLLESEPSWEVQRFAGRAAALYGDPMWVPALERLAWNAWFRQDILLTHALTGLGAVGTQAAGEALLRLERAFCRAPSTAHRDVDWRMVVDYHIKELGKRDELRQWAHEQPSPPGCENLGRDLESNRRP